MARLALSFNDADLSTLVAQAIAGDGHSTAGAAPSTSILTIGDEVAFSRRTDDERWLIVGHEPPSRDRLLALWRAGARGFYALPAEAEALRGAIATELAEPLVTLRRRNDRFVSLFVHDLRSPLSVVRLNLSLLLDGGDLDPAETREVMSESHLAVLQAMSIVEGVREISRAESVGLDYALHPGDVGEVVAHAVERQRPRSAARGVVIEATIGQGLAASLVENPLTAAVEDLIAVMVRHATAKVLVDVTRQAGRLVIAVENDGAAIPPETRPTLSDTLASSSLPGATYRSLGLQLARCVAAAHHGAVECTDPKRLAGARFELSLPAI